MKERKAVFILFLSVIIFVSCSEPAISLYKEFYYSNPDEIRVKLSESLSEQLYLVLSRKPDIFSKGILTLDTKKYLLNGKKIFQISTNEIVLVENNSYKKWYIKNIGPTIDRFILESKQ